MADEDCVRGDVALTRAFAILGMRWTGLIVGQLGRGPSGFRQLSRAVGKVSDSVLSERLSTLTDAGLVRRTVSEGPPVTVSYRLTASGQALLPVLGQLSTWADEHLPSA